MNLKLVTELSLISSMKQTGNKKEAILKQHQNTEVSRYLLNYSHVLPTAEGNGEGWSPAPVPQALLGICEKKAAFKPDASVEDTDYDSKSNFLQVLKMQKGDSQPVLS